MGAVYATVEDVMKIIGGLTVTETTKATALLETVSAEIRLRGRKYGVDVDARVSDDEDYALIVKSVAVNTVVRSLGQAEGTEGLSQMTQTALGYTFQGTFANPGNVYYLSKSDLKKLGFGRQMIRGREIYDVKNDNDPPF